MDNENTYRYGAGTYHEQDLEIQRAQERQARQQEEDARRVHDEQMAAIERQRSQQQQQSYRPSQKQATSASSQSAPATPNETLSFLIAAAGMIIGIYAVNIYVEPKEDWHIWGGIAAGGGIAYLLRDPIKQLLKVGIVIGLIYVGIVYVLPALTA